MNTSETIEQLHDRIVEETLTNLFSDSTPFDSRMEFINTPTNKLGVYHSTVGRDLRNMYNLWNDERLVKAGEHPDDFSFDCLKEVHRLANERFRNALVRIK